MKKRSLIFFQRLQIAILVVVEKNGRALLFQIAFKIIRSAELN